MGVLWSLYVRLDKREDDWPWKRMMMNNQRRRFEWVSQQHSGLVFTMLVDQWNKGFELTWHDILLLLYSWPSFDFFIFWRRYHYNVADERLSQHIQKGNEDGLFISSVASCASLWALIMDAGTGFTSQVYELSSSFLHKVG